MTNEKPNFTRWSGLHGLDFQNHVGIFPVKIDPKSVPWMDIWLSTVGIGIIALLLTACGETRQEHAVTKNNEIQKEVTTTETRTAPVVADVPMVGTVTIQPTQVIQTVTRERTTEATGQSDLKAKVEQQVPPVVAAAITAAPSLANLLPGGGLIASLGGIAFGAYQMLEKRKLGGALSAVVNGIEDAKDTMDKSQVDKLHDALSSSLDKSHKSIVRTLKA